MFGEIGPKVKGGLTRLQQLLVGSVVWIKGPPESDLTISGGDTPLTGRTVAIVGGAGVAAGSASVTGGAGTTGGAVSIAGGVGTGGAAGAANLTGGNSNSTAGAVNVTGGSGTGGSTAGADVNITGGNGSGQSGGGVRIRPGSGTVTNNIVLDGGRGAALTVGQTYGFVTLPRMAGKPTSAADGANANNQFTVPIVVDHTNFRLYASFGDVWRRANFGGVVNNQSANYTTTFSDSGPERAIVHPSSDVTARTFTIPANASVGYDIGTQLTFINDSVGAVTIAITTDTLVLEGAGTTGSRTLAQFGRATATKIAGTRWYIAGTNLT